MYHLRYTHVFISNSARVLEGRPVCKQLSGQGRDFAGNQKTSTQANTKKTYRNIAGIFRLPQYASKKQRLEKFAATKNGNANAKKHPVRIAFLSIR
ncbi:hypothetical protein [Herbaspirillum lusitanum]|uniref:hypothetical protein n=1 Tax=Herbaspirillum lusitanum TaxID=213312 RepID=UPI001EE672DF|nr:hypothetical protein [Herbaspirillum lusitanum]